MTTLALALLTAAASLQDSWKIDVALDVEEREGRWVFAIDGSSNLPPETVLRVRIYVVSNVVDPVHGPMEDEEPLVREDDDQPGVQRIKGGVGKFRHEIHSFARKPYSLIYRAKVQYLPTDQSPAVALKVGNQQIDRKADLRLGTELQLEAELRERVLEVRTDLLVLDGLGAELRDWIGRVDAQPAAWAAWKRGAEVSVGALLEKNAQRYSVWAIWPEYQARMRIRALGEFIRRMTAAAEGDEAGARRLLAGFEESMDDALTKIGIDLPFDGRTAQPAFAAYEGIVAPLRGGADAAARRKIRTEGVEALFDLLKLIRTRHRAYAYVNALGARFTRAVQLMDAGAPAEEIREALDAHDAALREFRTYAGLS